MPRVNASIIGSETDNARRMTRSMMEQKNPSGILLNNAFLNRRPEYYVYIYNAGDMEQRIERPWAHPAVVIPPCEEGEAYSRPFIIPDIVAETVPQAGAHGLAVNGVRGDFLAQDAIHPEQLNGDWRNYQKTKVATSGSFGTDLYSLGCWWSLVEDPEPDSEEVLTARSRLEATYQGLIQKAKGLSLQGEKGMGAITPLMHRAADYFKLEDRWHERFTAKVSCPGCGMIVPMGITRHMPKDSCGYVFNWLGAIKGGMATREEARAAGVTLADEQQEMKMPEGEQEEEKSPAPRKRTR